MLQIKIFAAGMACGLWLAIAIVAVGDWLH